MKSPKRLATPVSPPDPVKRRLLKKTDLKSDDVLMSVKNKDTDLLHTVNTLLKDETGEEEKPWSEEVQKTKILSVLDDHEEMMKGRQKELNSLKEVGAMTAVKRSKAVGKTSDSNTMARSRKRRTSEILVSLERLQSMSRAHTARDVFTNTVHTVSESNAGCELTRQKQRSRVRPHHNCN